jgi:putative ABC transport system permease protein
MAGGTMECLPMVGSAVGMFPHFQDKDVLIEMELLAVDYNFLETMGLELTHGRYFSNDFGSDMTNSIILNETVVKQLGITDPVGKLFGDKTIIGVLKDFNLHSIHSDIPALCIMLTDKYIRQVAVLYERGSLNSNIPMLESEWEKIVSDGRPLSYTTIEELVKTLYTSEKNLSAIVFVFALFTMLIAALGLFGLTLFLTRTRIKEIGIKKVFGCSEQSIVYSFLRVNFIQVLISAMFSIPMTNHFMTKWLNNFPYKVNINW